MMGLLQLVLPLLLMFHSAAVCCSTFSLHLKEKFCSFIRTSAHPSALRMSLSCLFWDQRLLGFCATEYCNFEFGPCMSSIICYIFSLFFSPSLQPLVCTRILAGLRLPAAECCEDEQVESRWAPPPVSTYSSSSNNLCRDLFIPNPCAVGDLCCCHWYNLPLSLVKGWWITASHKSFPYALP